MHFEAIQVHEVNDVQCAVDSTFDSDLGALAELSGYGGPFVTTEILGREYVLYMTPHCD